MRFFTSMRSALLTCAIALGFNASATDVTFRVDASEYSGAADISTEGVTLNGNFNGWCGNCAPMDDTDGDGVYELTIDLAEGDYEYKFAIGAWADQEVLTEGSPCTLTTAGFTNRVVTVGADASVLDVVCWNLCGACGSGPVSSNVTFQVDMNEYAGTADYLTEGVTLNGVFNGWCGNCAPMDDADGDGIYALTLSLPEGNYDYKFAIGPWTDQEMLVEGSSCTITTDGFTNRNVTVGAEAIMLDPVCWATCIACGVQNVTSDVTFSVDMNEYAGTADYLTEGVTLNGTFNGWCGNCAPMSDDNMDGVYELTVALDEGSYEYKFAIGPWTDQESLTEGSECTVTNDGFTNRNLMVGVEDMILNTVCWNACVVCEDVVVIPQYNITFQVDMNEYDGPLDYATMGVNVNGTFNDWCGTCWPMDDADMDGVYEFTALVDSGAVEYKFVIGDWAGQEEFMGGEPCTNNPGGFWNRWIEEHNAALVLDINCWNACEECQGEIDPCPAPSIEICENFDEYALGYLNGQAPHWGTWSGGGAGTPEDGIVSNEQAFSNGHSMLIAEGQEQDVLLLLGDKDSGNWTLDWQMYIPEGATAYYNFQGAPTAGEAFIVEIQFNAGGAAPGEAILSSGGSFTYPEGQWFSVQHQIDLTNDFATIAIDGEEVASFLYTSTNGDLLSSVDFFSINNDNRYYIDDILFDGMLDNVEENATATFVEVYPNPTSSRLVLSATEIIDSVAVLDAQGKQVLVQTINAIQSEMDLSSLANGMYSIVILAGNKTNVLRVVKQ